MSDLMNWMYKNYIKPNIDCQPTNNFESMQLNLLSNELTPQMQESLQTVLAYYATLGFRLGVRTGAALKEDLAQQ